MSKYTIALGNPWDGMVLIGIFDSFDEAESYAFLFLNNEWWIKEIEPK